MFDGAYKGAKVFLTGHTGFKGSWLALWLQRLGADVSGYSLPPPTSPGHFELLRLAMKSETADVRDLGTLKRALAAARPDIVFHLAAQPLVRESYRNPLDTFQTNVLGTLNVLEACRKCESVRAVVVVTSDKCYRADGRARVEDDPLGGHDPYSASKACAEILSSSYRDSFFHTGRTLLATCRAGNVIGGGDWAEDRLLPDLVRSACSGEAVKIRMPKAVRPWQHVLDPLRGYLLLGSRLLRGDAACAEAWNFGPLDGCGSLTVGEIAEKARRLWPEIKYEFAPEADAMRETDVLRLDCRKASERLGWRPVWDADAAVRRAVEWHRCFHETGELSSFSDLDAYIKEAGL